MKFLEALNLSPRPGARSGKSTFLSSATTLALTGALASVVFGVSTHAEAFQLLSAEAAVTVVNPSPRPAADYGQLPLFFEPAGDTSFVSRGQGYSLYLQPHSARVILAQPDKAANESPTGKRSASANRTYVSVEMALVGAQTDVTALGERRQSGVVNRLIGNDPAQWRTGIPMYGQVRYQSVYPGIDLVYYGNQRELEYDFVVAPEADPAGIRWEFNGVERVESAANGDLLLHTPAGVLRQQKPIIYQTLKGQRHEVAGRYEVHADRTVGFVVGDYDRSQELVIDPILSYATFLGGAGFDVGWSIEVDSAGNTYVTGETASTNIVNAPSGAYTNFSGGSRLVGGSEYGGDAFVAKLNADGSALVYFTYLGGSAQDIAFQLQLDSANNVYVAGTTYSTNFPVTTGVYQSTNASPLIDNIAFPPSDVFVAKLNPAGSALVYSTYIGGNANEAAIALAVDTAGSAVVVGETVSTNFPVTSTISTNGNLNDIFVTRLNPTGTALVYSTRLGGEFTDSAQAVDFYTDGSVLVAGFTESATLPLVSALQTNNAGGYDGYIFKLSADGNTIGFATYLGGESPDYVYRLKLDSLGNANFIGQTFSANFPITNAWQTNYGGAGDVFLAKLNAASTAWLTTTYFGGDAEEVGWDIGLDASDNIFFVGQTASTNLPLASPLQTNLLGSTDGFVAQFAANGSNLVYATYLGGDGDDHAYGLAVAADGTAYVTGRSYSTTNFPTTAGSFQVANAGGDGDAFIVKLLPAAAMHVEQQGGNLVITWPVTQPAYQLQYTESLTVPITWTAEPTAPTVANGQNTVTLPLDTAGRFYRLQRVP